MRKIILLLMLCALPSLASAVGGPCPTGANYLTTSGQLTTLAALGITNCFYIAANGSDSNTGVDEAHPWVHAPAMPGATGNPGSHTVAPGEGYIFKGGDTWHFGDSGLSPFVTGTWDFNHNGQGGPNGTATNPIYIGVDKSWFSGSSWVRPIFNADNPTELALTGCSTNSSGTSCLNRSVTSCLHSIGTVAGTGNAFISFSNRKYFIFDNFEMTGLCSSVVKANGFDRYVSYGSETGPLGYYNLYIHGWTHVPFFFINSPTDCCKNPNTGLPEDCGAQPPNPTPVPVYCESTETFGGDAGNGSAPAGSEGDTLQYVVVDGFDSDPRGAWIGFSGFFNVHHCAFRYISSEITKFSHVFHDNLEEFWYDNGHSNLMEESGNSGRPQAAFYNNVVRSISPPDWPVSLVGWWLLPSVGQTYYAFNNLWYQIGNIQYWNVGGNGSGNTGGIYNYFNNTLQNGVGASVYIYGNGNIQPGAIFNSTNDHLITDTSSPFQNSGKVTATTERIQTNSQATSTGYTTTQTPFVYAPTSSSSPTVGTGTNMQAQCTAMLNSSSPFIQAAGTACQSDTSYGPLYNSTTHTVTGVVRTTALRPVSGAWDVGTYQFGSSLPIVATPTFNPPAGSYSTSQSVTISTTTPGASITYCQDTTNACNPTIPLTSPVVVSATNSYIRAQATKSGFNPSAVASALYQIGNWSVVQHVKFTSAPACNGTTSCTLTVASTGSGHVLNIAVATSQNTNAAFSSISDNKSEAWTICSACATQFTGSDGLFYKNFDGYLLSSSAGVTTVTVTAAAPVADWSMGFVELSLASGTPSFDSANAISSADCTSCVSPSLTLTGTVDAVLQEANPFHGISAVTGNTTFQDFDWNGIGFAGTMNTSAATVTWTQSGTSPKPAGMSAIAFSSTGSTPVPVASLSPTGFTFSTNKNTTSAVQIATLQNIGAANMTVSGDVTTGMFTDTQTGSCPTPPYTLTPGQPCTYAVTFTPNATGSFTGSLSVTDNAAGSPHSVSLSGTGTAPIVSWVPTSFAFGNVSTSAPATSGFLVLSNAGNGPTTGTLSYSDTHFTTSTTTCGATLAAGQSCNVQVQFAPTSNITYSSNLIWTDTSGIVAPQNLALTGTGVPSQVAMPTFSPTPGTYTGPITINESTGGAIVCFRTDGGTPTTIVAGTCASAPTQTYTSPISLSATATLTAIGTLSGSANSALASGVYTVLVPAVLLTPTPIAFSANINTTSAAQAATLTNVGNTSVIVSSVSVTGNFTNANTGLAGQCIGTSFTLAVGTSCTINITFSPTATIAYTGTLSVTDNVAGSPQIVNLTGQGTQATISWSSPQGGTTYNFGNALVGIPVNSGPLTLNNTGTGPLNVAPSITGADATKFTIASTTCSSPLPGSCTFIVTFTPTAAASYSAFLTETDANATNSPQSLTLNGTGVTSVPVTAPWAPVIIGGRRELQIEAVREDSRCVLSKRDCSGATAARDSAYVGGLSRRQ